MTKNDILNNIVKLEGGYVNHPDDLGGPTNFGITQNTARAYGYFGDIKKLTKGRALEIYDSMYWASVNAEKIMEVSDVLAYTIVDSAINSGVYRASSFLQRAINVFNGNGSLYDSVNIDGIIGNKTINALNSYVEKRKNIDVLIDTYKALRTTFCVEISESRPENKSFVFGWVSRIYGVKK